MHRAAIYFFFDPDGIADRYVDYFLTDLARNVDRLVVVCNGFITDESKAMFLAHTPEVIVRENVGFDVWAYKTAIEYMGWEALRSFDEVALVNFTIMGPVFPLEETFSAMEGRDVDFWGITKFQSVQQDPFNANPYGFLPEHIQSHFTVYRSSLLKSQALEDYWATMPTILTYEDSVGKHESFFTKHFADMGFRWAVTVDPAPDDDLNRGIIYFAPTLMMQKYRCPIFKRRSFFQGKDVYLVESAAEAAPELLRYLEESTDYDTSMIWENIIRTCHSSDVVDALSLVYPLPSDCRCSTSPPSARTALAMHLYFPDLLEESVHYASSMPADADIFVTTSRPDMVGAIEEAFSRLPNTLRVIEVPNVGRDVGGFLLGSAPLVKDYDLVCVYHDKKAVQNPPGSIGRSFAYRAYESVLGSPELVANIVDIFAANPYLGLLSPLDPNHGPYYPTLGKEWRSNCERTKAVLAKLGVRVPISEDKPPVAPLGGVFWARASALAPLIDFGFAAEDFPRETGRAILDGSLIHAIERIYPFIVQSSGYYPAYVVSQAVAALELTNLHYQLRTLNLVLFGHGIEGDHATMAYALNKRLDDADLFDEVSATGLQEHIVKYLRRKASTIRKPSAGNDAR